MKKKGFTLVEVLVATVILLTAIIGTSAFFYFNRQNLVKARLKRQATITAVNTIEELKGMDYYSLTAGTLSDTALLANALADIKVTIGEEPEDGIGYLPVTVEVTWDDDKEKLSLSTFLTH